MSSMGQERTAAAGCNCSLHVLGGGCASELCALRVRRAGLFSRRPQCQMRRCRVRVSLCAGAKARKTQNQIPKYLWTCLRSGTNPRYPFVVGNKVNRTVLLRLVPCKGLTIHPCLAIATLTVPYELSKTLDETGFQQTAFP